ncbi:MAG TPA: Dabb family protein [Candidatus Methanoperedens sp.]|nr:Dabb family protein [Candidatus Methanoperedens sp.]
MITHVVLFQLKDRSPESIEKARDILLGMKGKISQLRYLEVGTDVLHSERSYDIALITKFDSMKELQAYQVHPVHVEVAKYIMSESQSAIAVDFISQIS